MSSGIRQTRSGNHATVYRARHGQSQRFISEAGDIAAPVRSPRSRRGNARCAGPTIPRCRSFRAALVDDRTDDAFRRDQHGDDEDEADDQDEALGVVGQEVGDVADEAGAQQRADERTQPADHRPDDDLAAVQAVHLLGPDDAVPEHRQDAGDRDEKARNRGVQDLEPVDVVAEVGRAFFVIHDAAKHQPDRRAQQRAQRDVAR